MTALWQGFVNNLEAIAFYSALVAAGGGLAAFLVVFCLWHWLESRYQEAWAKYAVAFFRMVAALAAVTAKPAPLDPQKMPWEQPWAPTIVIAAVGYLLWEVAGARGDQKYKRAKERTAAGYQQQIDDAIQDREDAEFEATRLGWLLTHLRESVNFKRQRIRAVAEAMAPARASIQQARAGLSPGDQLGILMEGLASLFRMQAMHGDGSRHRQNFRIGLFADDGGRLVPRAAFDLATKNHEPFSSYAQHAERYSLGNDANPSYAVRCVREGRTLIVADCAAEPGFYLHDRQANYLKSMVAFPIAGFCPDGLTPAHAALLVDTDVAGFFTEDDREMIESMLTEFVARIDLEYAISGLTG